MLDFSSALLINIAKVKSFLETWARARISVAVTSRLPFELKPFSCQMCPKYARTILVVSLDVFLDGLLSHVQRGRQRCPLVLAPVPTREQEVPVGLRFPRLLKLLQPRGKHHSSPVLVLLEQMAKR